jgi:hypothetical protein
VVDSYFWERLLVAFAAVAVLVGLAARDVARDGRDTRRAKEYAFLLATTFAAVAYGVLHDQLTVTLSPEYFLEGKGLAADPRPLRWAVALLAVRASWWIGLALGAAFLIANNPRRSGRPPQLPYAELGRLAAFPLVAACVGAAAGAVNATDPLGLGPSLQSLVPHDRARAFLLVWGVHTGSYAGAVLGATYSVVLIVVRRRQLGRGTH